MYIDIIMKKSKIIFGAVVAALGLLISLGPQFLFHICGHGESNFPQCYWSGQAEIAVGFIIVALGICMIIVKDPKTILGLAIGVFLASLVALFIPHSLIGGCSSPNMKCQKIGFPALTAESIVSILFSIFIVVFLDKKYKVLNG